eukprot:SAG11_NODE_31041_length_295_cov_1.051020_1_plen_26_part_10
MEQALARFAAKGHEALQVEAAYYAAV